MKKFQSFDRNARLENDTVLDTIHQNTITCVRVYRDGTKISTSGNDGQLVIWDIQVKTIVQLCVSTSFVNCFFISKKM